MWYFLSYSVDMKKWYDLWFHFIFAFINLHEKKTKNKGINLWICYYIAMKCTLSHLKPMKIKFFSLYLYAEPIETDVSAKYEL